MYYLHKNNLPAAILGIKLLKIHVTVKNVKLTAHMTSFRIANLVIEPFKIYQSGMLLHGMRNLLLKLSYHFSFDGRTYKYWNGE